ncbi:hypothetical protein EWM64_g8232 [Hericium alpestre]|uniref:Uncharacterized protein n=1 Tax=Hericium alpestre TaxID=135208 RepID=A0A4Y9ZNE6_9AGAM|nr:hypothetical protein EWM64_g8232 [Hericium alpestre]
MARRSPSVWTFVLLFACFTLLVEIAFVIGPLGGWVYWALMLSSFVLLVMYAHELHTELPVIAWINGGPQLLKVYQKDLIQSQEESRSTIDLLETQRKEFQLLETRLTHEQLKCRKATIQYKLLVDQVTDHNLLLAEPCVRKSRLRFVKDSVLAFWVLWGRTRLLAHRSERLTLAVSDFSTKLQDSATACDNLRLDNGLLKVSSNGLSAKLKQAEAEKTNLSKRLVAANVQYQRSLHSREKAAEAWMAYRQKSEASKVRCTGSLLLVIAVLWHFKRHLASRLAREMQATLRIKEDLASARAMHNSLTTRYDSLHADREQAHHNLGNLEGRYRSQGDDLDKLRDQHKTLQGRAHDLDKNVRETGAQLKTLKDKHGSLDTRHAELLVRSDKTTQEASQTRTQLKHVTEKYDSLQTGHAEVLCRYEMTDLSLNRATSRCVELEADYTEQTRTTGLSLSLLARHIQRERIRMEEEKLREFRPVHNMMADLRSRLAMADAYVQKMVHEPLPPGGTTPLRVHVPPQVRMSLLPSPPASANPSPVRPMVAMDSAVSLASERHFATSASDPFDIASFFNA